MSRAGSMRVETAHITSFQSRTLMSSSTTITQFVYMNWRRDNHEQSLRVHERAAERPDGGHHALGVAGIGLRHAEDADALAVAFGRQPEIDDLRELLGEQRNENHVEHFTQDRWLVGRASGEG